MAFLRFCLRLGGADLVPEFLGQLVEVEALEDVVEGLGAHVGAEDLSPALLEFAVADLADEGEGAQFHQLIALARGLVDGGGGLIFQLGAQGFHLHVGFGLDLAGLHLEVFQLAGRCLSFSSFSSASSFFWTIFCTWLMCLLATLSPASRIFSPVSFEDDGLLGRLAHLVLQGSFSSFWPSLMIGSSCSAMYSS